MARYILRNPQKAGICRFDEYPWSSWKEIVNNPDITNYASILETAGGYQDFRDFVSEDNDDEFMDISHIRRMPDESALILIRRVTGLENPLTIAHLPDNERNSVIGEIKKMPLSERQIARLTGVDRSIIRKC